MTAATPGIIELTQIFSDLYDADRREFAMRRVISVLLMHDKYVIQALLRHGEK